MGYAETHDLVLAVVDDLVLPGTDGGVLRGRLDDLDAQYTQQVAEQAAVARRVQTARETGRWDIVVRELERRSSLTEREATLLRVARRKLEPGSTESG
jgi:hypothetical protein